MPKSTLISDIWTHRSLGEDLSGNFSSVTKLDVEYISNYIYPFLQLVNSDAVFSAETEIKFIATPTGWTIHDYGEATSVSVPHNIEQKKTHYKNAVIADQIKVSKEVANLIAEKGWKTAEVISGSKLMIRLIWIESKRFGFKIEEFTPSPDDEICLKRVQKHIKDSGASWEKKAVKMPAEPIATEETIAVAVAFGGEETEPENIPEEKAKETLEEDTLETNPDTNILDVDILEEQRDKK